MTPALFEAQIKRLESQWPKTYGEDRRKMLWSAFRDVSDSAFTDAVSDCLMTYRMAPLANELEKAVEQAKTRERESRWAKSASFSSVLGDAAKNTKATPEFVKTCMSALAYKREKGIKSTDPEWEEILVTLGKSCGMTRNQSLYRDGVPPTEREAGK